MIERAELAPLIPHSGSMCLLDKVLEWDDSCIYCTAVSHCAKANPLRSNAQLSAIHLIEYAAQSMAVHGALLAGVQGEALGLGYLACVKNVKFNVKRIDDLQQTLHISAQQLVRQGGSMLYQFRAWVDVLELGGGRITVMEGSG